MPIPEFVVELRRHVGHAPLWLIGVTAVVLRDGPNGREILLVRRADTGEWTPVTGIVDPGEEPHTAVVREVAEEARVVARVERLVWVSASGMVTHVNGDQAQYLDHTFACAWESGEPAVGDDESTDTCWWPLDTLPPMPPVFRERIAVVLGHTGDTLLGRAAGARYLPQDRDAAAPDVAPDVAPDDVPDGAGAAGERP